MKTFAAVWVVAALTAASFAVGPDVMKQSTDGTPVPDVNKPVPGDPADNSCWMATASNMLGAAGYGVGATAQIKADYIYNQLRNDLNPTYQGYVHQGINYWLYTYGKNPDAVEFDPTNPYTDVTWSGNTVLTSTDYDFLLDELVRCQYVGVSFNNPEHAMTLVGGTYSYNAAPDQSTSIWHDSDRGFTPPGDDVYLNQFTTGQWNLSDYVATQARDYTTLCPGLNKPEEAMTNFDVAWYRQTASMTPGFRQAGVNNGVYEALDPAGAPTTSAYWVPNGQYDPFEVMLPNQVEPDKYKEVWLLVDYFDRVLGRTEDIRLLSSDGIEYLPTSVGESLDGGQLMFYWELPDQPDWEKIIFPNADYYLLSEYVKDWDIATECVPEPITLTLLGLGGLALLRRRKK